MPKHRQLKGLARNLSQKFSVFAGHFAYLASKHQQVLVTIDLLSVRIVPESFEISRNLNVVEMCKETLDYNLRELGIESVARALLEVSFVLTPVDERNIAGATFKTTITDGNGKDWIGIEESRPQLMRG